MAVRLITVAFLFVTAAVPANPLQREDGSLPFVEKAQKEFRFHPGGKIQVQFGVPGTLKIAGWSRPLVRIETEKVISRLAREEAEKLAADLALEVRWSQTSANIGIRPMSHPAAMFEINSTLHVPKDKTDLKVFLVNGDLAIDTLNGWVEATLQQGSLEIVSVRGYFSLLTHQGDVSVSLSERRWDGLGFTAATRRGAVTLRVPPDFSAALQLSTQDGSLTLDFPEPVVDGERVPLRVLTNKNARSFSMSVGDGGAPIRLLTESGDVLLKASP